MADIKFTSVLKSAPTQSELNKRMGVELSLPKPLPEMSAVKEPPLRLLFRKIDESLPGYKSRALERRARSEARALMLMAATREDPKASWKDFRELAGPKMGVGDRALRGMASGALNATKKIIDTLNLPADSRAVTLLSNEVGRLSNIIRPGMEGAGDGVARQVGEGLTFFLPGVGSAKLFAGMQYVSRSAAAWGGALTAAFLEASAEAGSLYNEMIKSGSGVAEARSSASQVFWGNMALVGSSNKLGILADSGGMLVRGVKGAGVESLQTFSQLGLSDYAEDGKINVEQPIAPVVFSFLFGGTMAGIRGATSSFPESSPGGVFQDSQSSVDMVYDRNAGRLKLDPDSRNAFRETLHKDALTGYGVDEDRLLTVSRARQHVALTGQEAVYGEIDISNLGGLNNAVGRAEADRIFKRITEIVDEELKPVINGKGGTIEFFRHGGDEFSFVATSVPNRHLEQALDTARSRVVRFIEKEGLSDIPHLKYPNDPHKSGVSISFGTSRIDNNIAAKETFKHADKKVERGKKRTQGLVKKQTADDQRSLVPDKAGMLPDSPSLEKIRDSRQAMEEYLDSLPESVRNSKTMIKPEEVNAKVYEAKARSFGLNRRQERGLLRDVSYDPVTGFHSKYDRFNTMARAINTVKQGKEKLTLVSCELRGLNSLNAKYGATGANEAFKKIAEVVQDQLGGRGKTLAFRNNGPRFEILVKNIPADKLQDAIHKATREIDLWSKELGWDKLHHPKYSHFASQDGVGIYAAATEFTPDTTPLEMFYSNSLKIREKEMNHLSVIKTETPRGE